MDPRSPLEHPFSLQRLGTMRVLSDHPALRWEGDAATPRTEHLAEETPVTLVYNQVPHVVMMLTPADLDDFAIGFSLTEGLISSLAEVREVQVVPHARGVDVHLTVSEEAFRVVDGRSRRMSGRTGCGVCGSESVDTVLRPVPPVGPGSLVHGTAIRRALDELEARQALNAEAHAVHAAGWAEPSGAVVEAREDVGRHNALDKLIGALVRAGRNPQEGFLVVTSRASFEMVHKAGMFGSGTLVAVGGVTALAVRIAHGCGVTLVGFARNGRHTVYTHPHRVVS